VILVFAARFPTFPAPLNAIILRLQTVSINCPEGGAKSEGKVIKKTIFCRKDDFTSFFAGK
jgi:hypothetical protein